MRKLTITYRKKISDSTDNTSSLKQFTLAKSNTSRECFDIISKPTSNECGSSIEQDLKKKSLIAPCARS